ncbi:MAG: hypothetical protein KIT35_03540 [Piscinibacter sp.]|uniref:hypothetical protein n=1 Tax=Piscinibacter sp. TaxID=1903157 RepID=UPI0025881EEC|nr:hypothetical protein [Piscinibacter sp.]MCW5662884.1 hypothetical protein [Piscinibacter sp.]
MFTLGLGLVALACLAGAQLTADWNRDQFVLTQALQALGQPMALVSLLFLVTGVVQPTEGPFVAGTVNTLRALGLLLGGTLIAQLLTTRRRFHTEMLLDHAGAAGNAWPQAPEPSMLIGLIGQQSLVLSVADAYRALGVVCLLMIPLVLVLMYLPPPGASVAPAARASTPSSIG